MLALGPTVMMAFEWWTMGNILVLVRLGLLQREGSTGDVFAR